MRLAILIAMTIIAAAAAKEADRGVVPVSMLSNEFDVKPNAEDGTMHALAGNDGEHTTEAFTAKDISEKKIKITYDKVCGRAGSRCMKGDGGVRGAGGRGEGGGGQGTSACTAVYGQPVMVVLQPYCITDHPTLPHVPIPAAAGMLPRPPPAHLCWHAHTRHYHRVNATCHTGTQTARTTGLTSRRRVSRAARP